METVIAFILIFGSLVFFHELGHFIFAKRAGIMVREFAIGMGPKIFGMNMREAILEAGATRLRPILMTAIATIGAMLPMAFGGAGGGLISKDLAITVIGGLLSSTLLTLIIVPIVYEVLSKLMKKNRKDVQDN